MMKKRITAFLVMLVMLMTSISVTYAENAEETAPVVETPIEILDTDEFHALYAMGFVGDELLNTDKNTLVTRAQFTGWLFKLSGYTLTEYKASEIPFRDVSIVTPYYNEICTMYQMGIVNGTDPEMFSPDAHVTYAQACKLIIDVLGYRNYAEIKYGEYPEGYVMMAGELEINDGVKNVVWNSELTAEDAVRMLYNGGMTSIVSFSGVDKFGNPTYKTNDKTLFEKNDIYYKEGQMQSSGVCSIKSEEAVEGITIINDIRYVSADCDLTDLVGCKVKYFYREDKASQKLLYAMADKRFSDILELKANELAITSSAYSLNNIVYYKSNGETEDAKINKFAFVIYNNSRIGIPTIGNAYASAINELIDSDDYTLSDMQIKKDGSGTITQSGLIYVDICHFTDYGADLLAWTIAEEISKTTEGLKNYLVLENEPVAPAMPTPTPTPVVTPTPTPTVTPDTIYAGGDGSQANPYRISNASQLLYASNQVNAGVHNTKSFVLTADIDFEGQEWVPFGSEEVPFNGTFDGDGHKVSNLKITTRRFNNGFFAYTGTNSVVKDFGLDNITVKITRTSTETMSTIGGMVGNATGKFENCYIKNSIVKNGNIWFGAGQGVGAFAAHIRDTAEFRNCYAYNVGIRAAASRRKGGFFAGTSSSVGDKVVFENCYSAGVYIHRDGSTDTSKDPAIFGFGGSSLNSSKLTVTNCYSTLADTYAVYNDANKVRKLLHKEFNG